MAYASGIGLRERHDWTQQIEEANAVVLPPLSAAIASSPMQSAAMVMQERGERYRERMADLSEKVAGRLESMEPDEIFRAAHK